MAEKVLALSEIAEFIATASDLVRRYGVAYLPYLHLFEEEATKAVAREVASIRAKEPKTPTVEGLEKSLVRAARIVERHGHVYLPIFLRIEEALEEARSKRDAMARVRTAAKGS